MKSNRTKSKKTDNKKCASRRSPHHPDKIEMKEYNPIKNPFFYRFISLCTQGVHVIIIDKTEEQPNTKKPNEKKKCVRIKFRCER